MSQYKFAILSGIIIGVVLFWGSLNLIKPSKASDSSSTSQLRSYSLEELKKYDGSNPSLPIYIALDGSVYDVSLGRKYYQAGGSYHYLAGKDSSDELHLIGGDIIKRKYKVVGKLAKN